MFANKSKVLFISSLLVLAYTAFLSVHFFGGTMNAETEIEALAGIFATALVLPHIIAVAVGTLLCILAFFLNVKWLAITAGISFIVAAVLFVLYGLFVLPMIILCFVGAAMVGKIKMAQYNEMTESILEDTRNEDGHFRGKMFGGFHRKDVLGHMHTLYGETQQLKREKLFYQEQASELQHLLQTIEESLSTIESLAQQGDSAPIRQLKSVLEEKNDLQMQPFSAVSSAVEMPEDTHEETHLPEEPEVHLPDEPAQQPHFTLENVEKGTFGAPPSWAMPQDATEQEPLPTEQEETFEAPAEETFEAPVEEVLHVEQPTFVVEQAITPAEETLDEQLTPVVPEKESPSAPKLRPTLSNPYPGQGVQRVKVRKV